MGLEFRNILDYYPFGWTMPGRSLVSANKYRFGYQGEFAEKDDETGWNSFELRSLDTRIGRWMNTDPAGQFWSPYNSMGNNPISRVDPDGAFAPPTTYVDSETGVVIADIDDGINQTVNVTRAQYDYMFNKFTNFGFDIDKNKADAFLFTMAYERWSNTQGSSINFSVTSEDPFFNSYAKENLLISNIDIDKNNQLLTLTFSGYSPVDLYKSSIISTGLYDSRTKNGNYKVWWVSPNKNSNMSLNTHPEAVFAVKFNGQVATHYYPQVPSYPASGGCARICTQKFAANIWTFSRVERTSVKVHGIWAGHR